MNNSTNAVDEQIIERHFLDAETFRQFSRPNPWRWLLAVSGEWAIIGMAMWICNTWPHWWLWIPAIFVIGTRQHALGIMAHEGVHFLVSRNRFWNDLLANLLSAYSLTYAVEGYRTNHLKHHRWLETPLDPERAALDNYPKDWTYPMPRKQFFMLLLRDIAGVYQIQTTKLYEYVWQIPAKRPLHILKVAAFHSVFIFLAIATGHLWTYLLLWLAPLFTVALLCFRLRTVAEHYTVVRTQDKYRRKTVDTLATTRTTMGCPITQFLIAPYNMSYHIEHHLYPTVPVFRLRALHRRLMKNPEFALRARVTRTYQGLWRELTT